VRAITIEVRQEATLTCCGVAQQVQVSGRLSARWQYNLFGEIEVDRLCFTIHPELQTVLCRECNRAIDLRRGDVNFKSGPVEAAEARSDLRYRLTGREESVSAEAAIRAALEAAGHFPRGEVGWA